MNKTKEEYKALVDSISEMENSDGRLGYAIALAMDEDDNYYKDIGRNVIRMCYKYPEQVNIVEETLIAITGWGLETLKAHMEEQIDDYNSLL